MYHNMQTNNTNFMLLDHQTERRENHDGCISWPETVRQLIPDFSEHEFDWIRVVYVLYVWANGSQYEKKG